MQAILASIAWSIVGKLLTERFGCELFVHGNRWWSDKTTNTYDDKVVDAMANALGVQSQSLKELMKAQGNG